MDEIREKLKPYVGKRIKIRGYLSKFDYWQDHRLYRDIGRACISKPEMNAEVLADHVWVIGVKHWPHDAVAQQVEFGAIVSSYPDQKVGGTNYCLTNPDELQVLHGPPALRIPEPPPNDEKPPQKEEPPMPNEKPPVDDSLETLRQVKAFTKAIGGQDQADKLVKALEAMTIPLPELITWIKVMGE